jgi:hypothetical protein
MNEWALQHHSFLPRYGDIIAMKRRTVSGSAIRWWTSSSIDHLACCIGGGKMIDATPRLGVSVRDIQLNGRCYLLRLKFKNPPILQGVGDEFLFSQLDKKYDWSGVAGFVTGGGENPKRWFCSELVYAWMDSMGIKLLERTEWGKTTPQAIWCSPLLAEINVARNNPPSTDLGVSYQEDCSILRASA